VGSVSFAPGWQEGSGGWGWGGGGTKYLHSICLTLSLKTVTPCPPFSALFTPCHLPPPPLPPAPITLFSPSKNYSKKPQSPLRTPQIPVLPTPHHSLTLLSRWILQFLFDFWRSLPSAFPTPHSLQYRPHSLSQIPFQNLPDPFHCLLPGDKCNTLTGWF